MQRLEYSSREIRRNLATSVSLVALLSVVLVAAACGGERGEANAQSGTGDARKDAPRASDRRVAACTLMSKEEMNAVTGASYTNTESNDDGHSTESSCHYFTASDPAGMSLNINWIAPDDYSNPAEHAALQRALLGGSKLGGKITAGMPTVPGASNGPVDGVGEEAVMTMMMLTARKGDYTVMVQIVPTDMMALMTDSTVAKAFVEKEKTVARKVLAKL